MASTSETLRQGVHGQERLYTLATFSKDPAYITENQRFIEETLDPKPGQLIIDVGCGDGQVTQMMVERLKGLPATIIGIDMNRANLDIARANVKSQGQTEVKFLEGRAEDVLPQLGEGIADVVYICNAIHEIPGRENKLAVMRAAFHVLKPNGKYHMNSTFNTEMFPSSPKREEKLFYLDWRKRSIGILGAEKDKNAPHFEILSPGDYYDLMEEVGFEVDRDKKTRRTVMLTADSLRAISRYSAFIDGQFIDIKNPDQFNMEQKSQALIQAVDEMEAEYREKVGDPNAVLAVGRDWIGMKGIKPGQE